MNKSVLRQNIREYLLNEFKRPSLSEDQIVEHINKEVEDFRQRALQLAIKNKYPYIKTYLEIAIYKIEEDIKNGNFQLFGSEELFLEDSKAIFLRTAINESLNPV